MKRKAASVFRVLLPNFRANKFIFTAYFLPGILHTKYFPIPRPSVQLPETEKMKYNKLPTELIIIISLIYLL